jgi:hypothetical protein
MLKVSIILSFFFLTLSSLDSNDSIHESWDKMLQSHVDVNGGVNYVAFSKEVNKLDSYLKILSANAPKNEWSKPEQMVFWINAYNAFTIKLVLDNYPVESIMKIEAGKAWDKKFIAIGTKIYSLNQIEHEILRKDFIDPRIHFALNCAALSCPKLHNKAFNSNNLEVQLEKLSREFINNSEKNQFKAESIKISQIFNWYAEDFTKEGKLLDFLNRYSKQPIQNNASISYLEYDWKLNSQANH